MENVPRAVNLVEKVALLFDSDTVPRTFVPSMNSTEPVGVPAVEVTVATKVTESFGHDGFGDDVSVVEVCAEAEAKFAVTVSGAFMVIDVEALLVLATLPVQLENLYPEFAVADRGTTVPAA
jgi:hypothetical protein